MSRKREKCEKKKKNGRKTERKMDRNKREEMNINALRHGQRQKY